MTPAPEEAAALPGDLAAWSETPFDQVPAAMRCRIYGVPYAMIDLPAGGELFLTRHGWPMIRWLLPDRWHAGDLYAKGGTRLTGGTGNVYRYAIRPPVGDPRQFVIKFSRSGEDVPFAIDGALPEGMSNEDAASARWNSPFEEFGMVHELRLGRFGPRALRVLTKRPAAIYCPPREFARWQLHRHEGLWSRMAKELETHQQGHHVELHRSRQYVLLFQWVEGVDAEECWRRGLLAEEEMKTLTARVNREIRQKGFRVLDSKPRHFILRASPEGRLLRKKNGELVYALVDFELLQRTQEYTAWLDRLKSAR